MLAGAVFAVYLTYLELFVIHAICQWCVLTAIIIWLLLLVEGKLVLASTTDDQLLVDDEPDDEQLDGRLDGEDPESLAGS